MNLRVEAKRLGVVAVVVVFAAAQMVAVATAQTTETGTAKMYSDKLQGKKTASGEVYDKAALTAAHKKLAFGTKVKVTNVANDKSVVVTINDRLSKNTSAVLDVSRQAAEELDFVKAGKAKVKVEKQ